MDLFNRNPGDLLLRLVAIDETWVHHDTPESKQQAKQWVGPTGTAQKRAKTQQSAGKFMTSVFLGFQRHIHYRLFVKRKTNQMRLLLCIIGPIERRNHKKTASFVEEKVLVCKTMHQLKNR